MNVSGAGVATQLGQFAVSIPHEVNVVTRIATGTYTFVAANGDTLTLRCDQVATPKTPGVLHGVDKWRVISGTGRFADATGSGTGATDADLNKGTFAKTMSGSIAFG